MIIVKVQGGLGNQLFQYAAALNLSLLLRQPIMLDTSFFKEEKFKGLLRLDKFKTDFFESDYEFHHSENPGIINKIKNHLFLKTSFFPFPGSNIIQGDNLKNPLKNIASLDKNKIYLLEGWLQKKIFLSGIIEHLSEHFQLKEELKDGSLVKAISGSNSVAVHIRRGDMAQNPNFINLGRDYYVEAVTRMKQLVNNPEFFVFSDDPDAARNILGGPDDNWHFITANSESVGRYGTKADYIDFALMRLCKHFIIANSTFSWWPAYLTRNVNSTVVCPAVWYQKPVLQSRFSKSGLLDKKWIAINLLG